MGGDQSRDIDLGVEACGWDHGLVLGLVFGPAGDAFGEEVTGRDVRGVALEPAAVDAVEQVQHPWARGKCVRVDGAVESARFPAKVSAVFGGYIKIFGDVYVAVAGC